ncbi:hypothetical protein [Streptomyces sp. 7N604]|uniref:hypothetical protein n=1 Tax=Streptomyces sp. 7N604 TaxID=3457415 RepID=UPI003FD4902E
MAGQPTGSEDYERVLDAVIAPVTEAYYSQRVQSGFNARVRAQAAQSTITLFAGGLIAALTVTTLADRGKLIQIVAIATVGLWLLAALLYMRAVAFPVMDLPGPDYVATREALIRSVLEKANHEAEKIDKRQGHANWVATAAVAMSVLTFALGVLIGPEKETALGTVVLEPSYREVFTALCGEKMDPVKGRVAKDSLNTPFVEVEFSNNMCGDRRGVLQIPRSAVKAVRWQSA